MPTVVVDRVATGIEMTREDLERELTDVQTVVFRDEAGNLRHLQGGEAVIWRAGRDSEYAIKVFKDVAERRAEPEFEKLQLLQSCPYIPRVYGFGRLVEDDDVAHPAIVEEYIHGVSLAELIASGKITGDVRDRYLDAMDAARIALELTRGICGLNGVGLAHRDISCHNVLLEEACVRDHFAHGVGLRLIDFGTSTDVARADSTVLGQGVRLATIPFGAPEIFGGEYYYPKQLSDGIVMPGRNSSSTDV